MKQLAPVLKNPPMMRGSTRPIWNCLFLAERHPSVNDRQAIGFDDKMGVGLYIRDEVDVGGDFHYLDAKMYSVPRM
jgi:hypothetical protein